MTLSLGYDDDCEEIFLELPDKPTPSEFADAMRRIASIYDIEQRHCCMDELLCKTLEAYGYTEGCEIFSNTPMWYA